MFPPTLTTNPIPLSLQDSNGLYQWDSTWGIPLYVNSVQIIDNTNSIFCIGHALILDCYFKGLAPGCLLFKIRFNWIFNQTGFARIVIAQISFLKIILKKWNKTLYEIFSKQIILYFVVNQYWKKCRHPIIIVKFLKFNGYCCFQNV